MNTVERRIADVFVATGLLAHEAGILPDALAELCVRADILAGDLLHQLMQLEFTEPRVKGDPKPVPTPKPPPPPTKPGPK